VPTLIVHTKDDVLASHDASMAAAARIPGARFLSLDSGGHLLLGQTAILRDELTGFLSAPVVHASATVLTPPRSGLERQP
jgi:pimeloyl-ACP methyl ester carboxylesterase